MANTAIVPLEKLDEMVRSASAIIGQSSQGGGSIAAALEAADAMQGILDAMEPHMPRVMKLMNTSLGFKTDRDPNKVGRGGVRPEPYDKDTVKVCATNALLRGVQLIGNHFNIISSNAYITGEGYAYLLKTKIPGFSDFMPVIGVPRKEEGVGMCVKCKATWKIGKEEQSIGQGDNPVVIPIKVDDFTTNDAVLGKARRKFFKRIYDQITGSETPDGEVGDDVVAPQIDVKTPQKLAETTSPAFNVATEPVIDDPDKHITELITKTPGITEEQLLAYLRTVGMAKATDMNIVQLADAKLLKIIKTWDDVVAEVKKHAAG